MGSSLNLIQQQQQLLLYYTAFSMTPPKSRRKHHHHQPQPATTDYDTDTLANAAVDYEVNQRTVEDLNTSVLRRYLPSIHTILDIANYAVLYTFNPDAQAWQKADIEGTLFVCATAPDEFCVMILNRRGLENFVADILSPGDIEVSGEYLYLRSETDGETYGLWIFSEDETSTADQREIIHRLIVELAKKAEASRVETSNGHDATEIAEDTTEAEAESVPMGRQLSLRELFGQQREQDSGFSVHSHQSPRGRAAQPAMPIPLPLAHHPHSHHTYHSRPPSTIAPPTAMQVAEAPKPVPTPQFQMSADTAFFMSGPSRTPQSRATPVQQPVQHNGMGKANGDALLALFRSTK